MPKPPLWLAMHEAGHAVALLANQPGPSIDGVSIIEQPAERLGEVYVQARFQPAWDTISPSNLTAEQVALVHASRKRRAYQDIIEYLAGPVAELRWRFRQRLGTRIQGVFLSSLYFDNDEIEIEKGTDFDRVRVRLRWLEPIAIKQAFSDAWMESEELIHVHWKWVLGLGRWLQRDGKISGDSLYDWWDERVLGISK